MIQRLTFLFLFAAISLLLWLLRPYFSGEQIKADTLKIIVPALLVVIGWLVTFWLQEYRHDRERAEKSTDLQLAFRAEIWDYNQSFIYADTKEYGRVLAEKIRTAGSNTPYHPFVPQEKKMVVFSSLVSSIDRLSPSTVAAVVQFYSQISDITAFAEDLRDERMAALPADRRAKAYEDYIDMKVTANKLATRALEKLNISLGLEASKTPATEILETKKQVQDWLNSQAVDHRDH